MSADSAEKKFPPPLPNPATPAGGTKRPQKAGTPKPDPGHPPIDESADDEPTDPSFGAAEPPAHAQAAPEPPETAEAAREKDPRLPELGVLDPLMADPDITEIMINDTRNVMVEKNGKLISSGVQVADLDELGRIVRNLLDSTGRFLTPDSPYVDTALADGSRVNVVGPPLVHDGPCVTIRRFPKRLKVDNLMRNGTLDQRMAYFLNVCVVAKMNILVAGGTGSGKTTLLNVLASLIPKSERIVVIEDTPELVVPHQNSVKMQTKPKTPASEAIPTRELVANALRMRPDRIVVGECRRAEAFDMLQAMNTGHEGSMTTLHANSPRDAISRLETLCLLAGTDLPLPVVRRQIASALDLVVHIRRFRDGHRRITSICEVTGLEGDTITTQDIFVYKPEKRRFRVCGMVPTFIDRLKEQGIELPPNYFGGGS